MAQRKVSCEVYTDRGIVGNEGKSAYQQAVEGGYQGTEEEFEQALASDITVVADNVTNINSVGNNIENVNTVAGNATNINTVATNISSINTAATNMPAIIAAPTEAANAANSATDASASATIATTQAELAKEYADSIDLSNYRTSADQDIIDATKATKARVAGYLPVSSKAVANGVASLDANAKVPSEQIPTATTSLGGVKPDGTTITVTEDGVISATGGSGSGSGFDFEGTKAEFDAAVAAGTITDDSVSLITDDVSGDTVATKAELQAVDSSKANTSLSNLSAVGKDLASGLGMPSNRYIDLTLGASGATYTAAANGWFCIYTMKSTAGYTYLENIATGFRVESRTTINGSGCGCYIPARKNDVIICNYDGVNNQPFFRFYYAEGEQS